MSTFNFDTLSQFWGQFLHNFTPVRYFMNNFNMQWSI